ncbi:hypothetical protein PENTCL1PPCAC_1930, partial [Pristionchus entomophagus]
PIREGERKWKQEMRMLQREYLPSQRGSYYQRPGSSILHPLDTSHSTLATFQNHDRMPPPSLSSSLRRELHQMQQLQPGVGRGLRMSHCSPSPAG